MGPLSKYSVSSVKIILLSLFFLTVTKAFSQNGELLFTQNCTACHTIGGGPLVGPDLKGVSEKYEESWLLKFIQSSQTMVKAGDEQAVATFQQYNMVPMPNFPFKVDEVREILDYIESKSTVTATVEPEQSAPIAKENNASVLHPEKKSLDYYHPYKRLIFWSFTLAIVTALVLIYFTTRS